MADDIAILLATNVSVMRAKTRQGITHAYARD